MTPCSELADIEWLTGSEAGAILAELTEDAAPLHTTADLLRKTLSLARTHLVLEQVDLRRRAAAKFTHAPQLFFTRTGLEQATDEWVARYKAERFQGHGPIADLCCGIGGDLMELARRVQVMGVDRDSVCAHFAAVNSGTGVDAIEAEEVDLNSVDAWHIDPDRRPSGRRTTSLEYCEPNLSIIKRLLSRNSNAAMKLAPVTTPPAEWADRCELEWISRDGECKQLVAWHGNLAIAPGERQATVLQSSGAKPPRTLAGRPNEPLSIVHQPDRFIFDVDPAVIAARLTGALAAEFDLSALSPGPTYLTGPRMIEDRALACFEVDEVLPMRVSKLAKHLHDRKIGELEIKKRGVVIDPEKLRRDLELRGNNSATLLITQIAGRPTAVLAHRRPT